MDPEAFREVRDLVRRQVEDLARRLAAEQDAGT